MTNTACVRVLCSVVARRYDAGDVFDFDPTVDADALYPPNPRLQQGRGHRNVSIQGRSGLQVGPRFKVLDPFWAFSLVWFNEGSVTNEDAPADIAEESLDLFGLRFAEDLARAATARAGEVGEGHRHAFLIFAAVFELVPNGKARDLRFVKVVSPGALQEALRQL